MQIVYARQPLPKTSGGTVPRSLFLAGPTPRNKGKPREEWTPSWRTEAFTILRDLGFEGTVFSPEDEGGGLSGEFNYKDQTRWEFRGMGRSSVVAFWVPREMKLMPGLTTNVEYGVCGAFVPDFMVLGCPPDAVKVGYLKQMAEDIALLHEVFAHHFDEPRFADLPPIPICDSLRDTLRTALELMPA